MFSRGVNRLRERPWEEPGVLVVIALWLVFGVVHLVDGLGAGPGHLRDLTLAALVFASAAIMVAQVLRARATPRPSHD